MIDAPHDESEESNHDEDLTPPPEKSLASKISPPNNDNSKDE